MKGLNYWRVKDKMEKDKPILKEEIITHGCAVDYICFNCGKRTSTPKILIVERIGKGKYKPIKWFCSKKCLDKIQPTKERKR